MGHGHDSVSRPVEQSNRTETRVLKRGDAADKSHDFKSAQVWVIPTEDSGYHCKPFSIPIAQHNHCIVSGGSRVFVASKPEYDIRKSPKRC